MRYPVKNMDSTIITISAPGSVPVNRSRISSGEDPSVAHAPKGTSGISGSSTTDSTLADQAQRSSQRKPRWRNAPGIQVSLQSQNQEPQFDEYRQLRSDGRRKDSTRVVSESVGTENINRTIDAEQPEKYSENSRSVNPRSKIILDSFIQQMGGAEQSLSSGSYINTSI